MDSSSLRKFLVTVVNSATIEVEADTEDAAYQKVDRALGYGDANIMAMIGEASSGWDITDCQESD